MFTGIVQGVASVVAVEPRSGHRRLQVDMAQHTADLQLGASVALSGVCLTVVETAGSIVSFDVIEQTLAVTNLGELAVGHRVNFERSLRAGDEIGGHQVSGHIMGVGVLSSRPAPEGGATIHIAVEPAVLRYILPKGFIAVDGCSLTVAEVDDTGFVVHLIPETLRRTTFGHKASGARVNVEPEPATVTIVETVERVLLQRGLASGERP